MGKDVRIPTQKRSIEKKENIKKTALMLFSDKGYHNVSTNEIAAVSGISIGTVYNYFTDKQAIYAELVDDFYSHIIGQLTPELFSSVNSPMELLEKYIAIVLEGHTYMTAFQKEIASLSYQNTEFRELENKYRVFVTKKIMSLMQSFSEYLRITDFESASFMLMTTIESVIHEILFFDVPYDKDLILKDLTVMLSRYLLKDGCIASFDSMEEK